VADATAILFTQTIGARVHLIDCLELSGEGLGYYAHEIHHRGYTYDRSLGHHAPHDISVTEWGTGKTRLEQAEEPGIYFSLVPKLSRQDGINAARKFLDRCVFDEEKCEPLLNALANYHKEWDERTKLFRDAPAHDWSSHFADAFRYLAVGHQEPLADYAARRRPAIVEFDVFTGKPCQPRPVAGPWDDQIRRAMGR